MGGLFVGKSLPGHPWADPGSPMGPNSDPYVQQKCNSHGFDPQLDTRYNSFEPDADVLSYGSKLFGSYIGSDALLPGL